MIQDKRKFRSEDDYEELRKLEAPEDRIVWAILKLRSTLSWIAFWLFWIMIASCTMAEHMT